MRSVGRKLASGKCPEMGANRHYDSNVEPTEPPGIKSDRWGRLIAGHYARPFLVWDADNVCRVHGRLRGRHESPHDGASREEPSNVDDALC